MAALEGTEIAPSRFGVPRFGVPRFGVPRFAGRGAGRASRAAPTMWSSSVAFDRELEPWGTLDRWARWSRVRSTRRRRRARSDRSGRAHRADHVVRRLRLHGAVGAPGGGRGRHPQTPGEFPFKHQRFPPAAADVPAGFRVLYPYADPRNAMLSIFRRSYGIGHYRGLHQRSPDAAAAARLASLDAFLAGGIDDFELEDHVERWLTPRVPGDVRPARAPAARVADPARVRRHRRPGAVSSRSASAGECVEVAAAPAQRRRLTRSTGSSRTGSTRSPTCISRDRHHRRLERPAAVRGQHRLLRAGRRARRRGHGRISCTSVR